jgi:hypothetical protein
LNTHQETSVSFAGLPPEMPDLIEFVFPARHQASARSDNTHCNLHWLSLHPVHVDNG